VQTPQSPAAARPAGAAAGSAAQGGAGCPLRRRLPRRLLPGAGQVRTHTSQTAQRKQSH
jgi:hypothetical protein